jgi:hypothetical protein
MPLKSLPPHLVERSRIKQCSACGQAFNKEARQSLGAAFKKHVLEAHRPQEGSDGVRLTAPGIRRKAAKKV